MKSNVKRISGKAAKEEAEEPAAPAGSSSGAAPGAPLDPAAEEERKRKIRARTRSKLTTSLKLRKDERVTFADVAGIGEAKLELQEVVDFFLKPEKFKRSGSRMPKGVLLCGPPGARGSRREAGGGWRLRCDRGLRAGTLSSGGLPVLLLQLGTWVLLSDGLRVRGCS